jgi:hypothetical protein
MLTVKEKGKTVQKARTVKQVKDISSISVANKFGVAYWRDELTAGTIGVWFHTGQNHPMIQQRHKFELEVYVKMLSYKSQFNEWS